MLHVVNMMFNFFYHNEYQGLHKGYHVECVQIYF